MNSYRASAMAYAAGARAFFAPGPAGEGERAGAGPVPIAELTSRAEALVPLSAGLTAAAAAQLAVNDPALCIQASIGLLAKALTDLEVSSALFSAAVQGEGGAERGRVLEQVERSAAIARPADLEDNLRLLLGEKAESLEVTERAPELPLTLEAARTQLAGNTGTTLVLIRDRASSTGWEALGGVAKLGTGKLVEAASLVSMEVADALGQTAQLTHLYELARDFLGDALASLKTLLGPALTQTVGDQVVGWVKDAASDSKFARLVEKLYETEPTGKALARLIADSPASLAQYTAAIQGVDALEAAYRKQVEVVKKILQAMKFVAIVPAVAVPHGRLLVAAAYILVGGYIVLAGGDYVDAQPLRLLDRVPGVRKVVETNLAQPVISEVAATAEVSRR